MAARTRAVIEIFIAGALWGIISIFIKKLSVLGMSLMQIVLSRMLVACVILALYLLICNRNAFKVKICDLWRFAGAGILGLACMNYCYFYTVNQNQASVGVVLLYTSPIFIMLFSALLFNEKITLRKIISLILMILGCVCVSGIIGGTSQVSLKVILVGICSGFMYAMYSIFNKPALKIYSPLTVSFYAFIFSIVVILPFSDVGTYINILKAKPVGLIWVFAIGFISSFLPYILYNSGLKKIDSSTAGIMACTEPVVGCLLGIFAYGESHELIKIIGMLCTLASIIILNTKSRLKHN